MPKISAKNSIILVNGYNYSTYATQYDAVDNSGMVDVTGFTEGGQNFIPGLPNGQMTINFLADATATVGTEAVFSAFPTGAVTLIPAGYTVGTNTISMPYMMGNYSPQGNPAGAVELGALTFAAYGSTFQGIEHGVALQHATITATTTSTPVLDPTDDAVTAICGGTLHVWDICADDTYVVKVQHCATVGGAYADLITFVLDGSTLGVERQVIASGVINKYRQVVATRTGANAQTFGFTVHFWHGTDTT